MHIVHMIDRTMLKSRLGNKSCFDKKVMELLFPYSRRKHFLLFLVTYGFIPYKGLCLQETDHTLFNVYDLNRYVMSFL